MDSMGTPRSVENCAHRACAITIGPAPESGPARSALFNTATTGRRVAAMASRSSGLTTSTVT
ncbi:Uncharacterised protein [Mycobacterium tuberculosis]|uniref:Uncharacterized protein n=1 Tax=Mycobacterium tuberculosis TaxID=1773 RepID=A0A654ZPV5_MYCTX|nr:Uncharacterised protein [Mycobacterium tuberculosis]CKQ54787.1 Uncharacterised protein [Mycobacterium tuberculosis]CKU21676.1 Uncharacterised protein [Mycobacterium tuberculosis]CNV65803.1 Uncharacterised protein [Mycobacterium tuberculosis]CNV76661.1 Uncharacterised protein [Mycobacterium tuberculosis]